MTTTKLWPAGRSCAVCGESYFPKSLVQVYCSPQCRESAKYRRIRDDPGRWDAYLARLRAQYVPTGNPPGVKPSHLGCKVADCTDGHLARGFCRKHYRRDRYRRGLDRGKPTELVSALVKHYDESGEFIEEPQQRRLVTKVGGSLLWPECPDCAGVMWKLDTTPDLDIRDCGGCRVRIMLNVEEVSWLTSGEPLTVRSPQTKS